MKMIPAPNRAQIQNQIIQEVMINLTVTYQLVRCLLVIYRNPSIEGDAAEAEVEAAAVAVANQKVHPLHREAADRGAVHEAAHKANPHVHIHVQHHADLDPSKYFHCFFSIGLVWFGLLINVFIRLT